MLTWQFLRDYEINELEKTWIELETRADGGFFLSWRWVSCWLRAIGIKPLLAKATSDGVAMGLGLLCPSNLRRHHISVRQLCLHETGRPQFDAITIEYNGVLTAREAPQDLLSGLLKELQGYDGAWDEIVLGGITPKLSGMAKAAGLALEVDRKAPIYATILKDIHQPDWISANLRRQLRQSQISAERTGPLTLTCASNSTQAVLFFDELVLLHTSYWNARNKEGAFATAASQSFHRDLINTTSDHAIVELLRLDAGPKTLGYLYNFRYGNKIYAYQSGFHYEKNNHHRPGLLAHTLAMKRGAEAGIEIYDFLAGDANYKARLGSPMGELLWCRAQRNRPMLIVERTIRKIRQKIRAKI